VFITVKYQANLPEEIEQQMVFEWAATMEYMYPCLRLMYHVPNEGKRTKATAAKMKRKQREYLDALRSEGYFVALCVGHEAAQDTILGYINVAYKREVSR
jgi:hypothetical protein